MTTPNIPTQSPSRRWPIGPIVILVAAAGVITWSQLADSVEGNFRGIFSLATVLLSLIVLAGWVMFFSGKPWGRRFKIVGIGFLCFVLFGVGIFFLTRREGSFTGAGFPRLVWIWSKERVVPQVQVAAQQVADLAGAGADDFPQFLGPQRDNIVHGAHLGRDWSAHPPELLWHIEVGPGWSGFAVAGNSAITMEQRGEQESTICYDLHTGKPVWVHADNAYLHEHEGGDGPRATPTIVGARVYTMGGLGTLNCLDGATGKVIWTQAVLKDTDNHLRYGQTSSPLIVDQSVIVTGGSKDPFKPCTALLAFDKDSGKLLWQWEGDPPSYASPSLATLAGVRQILVVHQNGIAGHDLADGHILWQIPWAPGFWPKTSQAVPVGQDRVYCSTGYAIGSIELQIHGPPLSVTKLWDSPFMKTELSNIILRDGCVFGLDDGRLTCQDVDTGKKLWRGDNFGHGQILQAGDLTLAQSEEGDVALLEISRAGPTELGRFHALSNSRNCWNTPALAGHLLLVRSDREAACYRLP